MPAFATPEPITATLTTAGAQVRLAASELGGASGSFDIDRAEGSVIAKVGNCPIRVGRMTRGQAQLPARAGQP